MKTGANYLGFAAAVVMALGCVGTKTGDVGLLDIPGGSFVMGDSAGEPDEVPRHVSVGPFKLMQFEVTNRLFGEFVAGTGYRTDAERTGWGYVWVGRWQQVRGADWEHPHGPRTSADGLLDHPVVQVSATDAAAFCSHLGLRLPTEAEWEFAARGTDGRRYPWGNSPPEEPNGVRRANFGTVRCCAPDSSDGYGTTAPIGRFPSSVSPFGVHDMAGNVWEWTASEFPKRPGQVALRGGGWGNNPYCLRTSYRHANPSDVGLDMVGFRCAGDRNRSAGIDEGNGS